MTVKVDTEFNHIPQIISQTPQITQDSLEEVGEFLYDWIYNRCPVKGATSGDGYYTSDWDPKDPQRAGEVRNSIRMISRPGEVSIGSNHIIAPKLEFGKGLGPPTSVTAKPFMRPGVDENRDEIRSRFGNQFAVSIKVVAG